MSSSAPPHPDEVVAGRYELLEEVGSGGMARVHIARDLVLDRAVAVKLLHPHLAADPVFAQRFLEEARTAARLNHPGVVAVHDAGGDGETPYLVMELVRGTTLRDVLETRGRLTPGETLALLEPMAEGLAAAHAAGLVHRDVKPENVLITDSGQVKLTDFGLARAVADVRQTMSSSVIVGSPHYLAPEVVKGEPLDARADVYALGILLYECLTGRPPFEGETPLATALLHTTDTVPPPSSLVPAVSPELDALVARCTSTALSGRPRHASAFVEELRGAVPEGPTVVDLRDGARNTVVIPLTGAETVIARRAATAAHAPVSPDAPAPRKRRRWPRRLLLVLVLAALGTGGWFAYDRVLAPVVAVPDLVGVPLDDAIEVLADAGLGHEEADDRPFDREVPAGSVVGTDPADEVRTGGTVTLVVSNGPRQFAVPSVLDQTAEDAEATLREAGFEVEVVPLYDPVLPAGDVIGTTPAAEQVAADGSTVVLQVSQGREPATVPDLTGLSESEALITLRAAGFESRVGSLENDDTVAEGLVLRQEPEALADAFVGDEVSIVVSRGPAPFAMPDVADRTLADARQRLEAVGLEVVVEYAPTQFADRRGIVDSQTPSQGQQVRRGDEVTLYVWQ